jgi:hypothetical protein
MKIKIERKEKTRKPKRQRKIPTVKVGTYKNLTIALWVLLISSMSFGIYKNFTAIDRHTIHEKEIIEQQIIDTNRIESFTKAFAKEYFSWQQSKESIDKRNENLKKYLTENLQQLNVNMIRSDIPTTALVIETQIWNVSQNANSSFDVLFTIEQQITEGESRKNILSTYTVTIHVDKNGDMVIIKNPTISSVPGKSKYQPKQVENDGSVDTATTKEIDDFLETFFKLYPLASEKELAYYVSNEALPVIKKNYIFSELIEPVYIMKGNQVNVIVTVKYLDQETKAIHLSQYELTLEKQENWKIIK